MHVAAEHDDAGGRGTQPARAHVGQEGDEPVKRRLEGGPVLVRLLAQIASRFGVVVTQKLAAQAVPVIGALGGAAVNYAFIDHFQEVARAHFVVRRLERRYGEDAVRAAYDRFSNRSSAAA